MEDEIDNQDEKLTPAAPLPKTFMQFNIDLWRAARNRHQKPSNYKPSWMDKVEKTRQEIMEKLSFGLRTPRDAVSLYSKSPSDSPRSTPRSLSSARLSHAILPRSEQDGIFQHELLEKQYQELRHQLFVKSDDFSDERYVKFDKKLPGYLSTPRKRNTPESSRSSTLNSKTRASESVTDYLQSNPIGSDHFFKHLECVKQMARRYRRSRRKHNIPKIIEVQVEDY